MNLHVERLIAVIVSCFFLFYTGFQAYRYFYSPYTTEAAFSYTVADTAKVSGIIIRDEHIITDKLSGNVSYLCDDGTKVSEFIDIAEIYASQQDMVTQRRIRSLEKEINSLEAASDSQVSQYGNAEAISRQIGSTIDEIVEMTGSGMVGEMGEQRLKLSSLMNRKLVATGKKENFDARISYLLSEKERLSGQMSQAYTTYTSPQAGYFVRMTDGYEEKLNPETMKELTVKDYEGLIGGKVLSSDEYVGKIITDHNWYYAALVDADTLEKFSDKVGDTVNLNFNLYKLNNIPFTVDSIHTDDSSQKAVVFLKSNYVLSELVAVRNPSADVVFQSFTGMKVDSSAVRYGGQTKGVYIIENDVIKFRTINTIYETEDFVLCGGNPDMERPLKLFDQVIVEGTDLKDGKSVNS